MRDAFGADFADQEFGRLFAVRGRSAEAPWRLALVAVLQFVEDLSDRRAADAVRARVDWRYALDLPLDDTGFDHTVLSEFWSRLVDGWTGSSTESESAGCSRRTGASAPTRRTVSALLTVC